MYETNRLQLKMNDLQPSNTCETLEDVDISLFFFHPDICNVYNT